MKRAPPARTRKQGRRGRLAIIVVWVSLSAGALGTGRPWAAELDPVALIWEAPAGCPSADAVQAQVETGLGGSSKDLAPVAAVVNVAEPAPGHWRARLQVHSHGQRTARQFEAESCEALSTAAALIIALSAEGPVDGVAGGATHVAAPNGEQTVSVSSTSLTGRPPPWIRSGLLLQIGTALESGTLPRVPAFGFEAAAGESWATSVWRLRVLGGLAYFVPQSLGPSRNIDDLPEGQYWAVSLEGRGCLTAVLSRFEIGPCLGGELVVLRGTNVGGASGNDTQYWASPLGSLMVNLAIGRQIALVARTEIIVPSTRRTVMGAAVPGASYPVYTVPAYAIRGAVGIEWRFF